MTAEMTEDKKPETAAPDAEPGTIVLDEHDSLVFVCEQRISAFGASPKSTQQEFNGLERELRSGLSRWPNSSPIKFLLGTLYSMAGESGLALTLLDSATGRQPPEGTKKAAGPGPLNNIAVAHKTLHRDDEAEKAYMEALAACADVVDPKIRDRAKADAFHGLASLYINRGTPDRCIYWADKALALNPEDRYARWNRTLALLERGDFAEGFDGYDEAGFMEGGGKPRERKLKTYGGRLKRWQGERGVKVVCYGEQGVGDELMFFSILPDLMKDCEVIIECDPRIEGLLKHSFPGVPVYTTSGIDDPWPWLDEPANADCTHFVPCGSLGRYYRRKAADFPRVPYLKAEPWLVEKWGRILDGCPRPRIAFSWAGGLQKTRMDKRTINPDLLLPILKQDATFFSLQYHPEAHDDVATLSKQAGNPIHSWGDCIGGPERPGYSDTAAFLQHMDLVITVNTSLVHLCGALGVPTLCLTPRYRAWRYAGESGPSYWYGSVMQINQDKDGEWGPVIEQAAERVRELIVQGPKPTDDSVVHFDSIPLPDGAVVFPAGETVTHFSMSNAEAAVLPAAAAD